MVSEHYSTAGDSESGSLHEAIVLTLLENGRLTLEQVQVLDASSFSFQFISEGLLLYASIMLIRQSLASLYISEICTPIAERMQRC